MKTIGIIGGLSYESTTHYYQKINDEVNQIAGGLTSAKMLIDSVNFAEIRAMMLSNRWGEIANRLTTCAQRLEAAGADYIAVASNTMHKCSDEIQWNIKVPFIHIADCVAEACKANDVKKVGLLGTKYTMTESFLIDRLKSNGLTVYTPQDANDINEIDRIIFDELCKGEIKPASKATYIAIVKKMIQKHGVQGVILGCTEIEMLLQEGDVSIPLFDTTQSHVEALADYCLEWR